MSDVPTPVSPVSREPNRLASIDGWRALAVLGVLWWHAWIHVGNPPLALSIAGVSINLQRLLVPLGNGVEFFFVLSGFCIQLSLTRGFPELNLCSYGRFVWHRWRRLTPAFYFVCAVTAAALLFAGVAIAPSNYVAHAFWLYGVWPGAWAFSPPFWSLQVEWEFYLLVPLLLLIRRPALRWKILVALLLASLVWRYYAHLTVDGIASGFEHLPMNFHGFAFGLILAHGWSGGARWVQRLYGPLPLIAGTTLAFVGRGLGSTEVFALAGPFGPLAKTLCAPLMTLGFALMIASTLGGGIRGFNRLLSSRPLQTIGRLSYGIYLWHWWPCVWIGNAFFNRHGPSAGIHYLTLAATLAISLPLAWITWTWFERPYFRSGKTGPAPAA